VNTGLGGIFPHVLTNGASLERKPSATHLESLSIGVELTNMFEPIIPSIHFTIPYNKGAVL